MKTSLGYKVAAFMAALGVRFDAAKSPELLAMKRAFDEMGDGGLRFKITVNKDGSWVAESINLEGILTGGDKADDIVEMIKDATLTYFGIPARYCVTMEPLRSSVELGILNRLYANKPKTRTNETGKGVVLISSDIFATVGA